MDGHSTRATDGDAPTRPTWGQVVSAPWAHMLQPARAAEIMAAASRPAFLVAFALPVVFIAATVVLLAMWSQTHPSVFDLARARATERDLASVWRDWHDAGVLGPAEQIFLIVNAVVPVLAAFAAWLFLPTVYRLGSVRRAFGLAYRGVASGVGLLAALVAVCGVFDVYASFVNELIPKAWILTAAATCGLVFWLTRASRALSHDQLHVEIPPRCEGCGYDLTHIPASGICPECALSTVASLTPDVRRPGCAWECRQDGGAWIDTTIAALLSPQQFYAGLRLRGPEPRRRFVDWHFLLIGIFVFLWLLGCLLSIDGPPAEAIALLPLLAMFLAPLLGWSVHRLVAAVVTSWAITQRMLPDVRWARTVMLYETAFLWAFCLFDGAFVTSVFAFDDWVSRAASAIIGRRFIFGVPVDLLFVLAGNAVLILIWFRRYAVAFRAIRWSNF